MKEFNLSSRIKQFENEEQFYLKFKDVKEFIRLLKEHFKKMPSNRTFNLRIIDELAGEDLI